MKGRSQKEYFRQMEQLCLREAEQCSLGDGREAFKLLAETYNHAAALEPEVPAKQDRPLLRLLHR
ncbi:hypothetical protein AS156_16270 [Bradyrhizobium macuxiense]|uniref:Uncharacterized protein n=1 Tax=Bradyrhizobium macuxiense TaxID=1755647 RepID=A0A125Q6X5_9BRAD|nr:hypothetical protein AS156_16270 [Bradyrhizobium macuxiense]